MQGEIAKVVLNEQILLSNIKKGNISYSDKFKHKVNLHFTCIRIGFE